MLKKFLAILKGRSHKNKPDQEQCSECIYYIEKYLDDYTQRHFGYGEVKIRPACSFANTYGFVSHNPASQCDYYRARIK